MLTTHPLQTRQAIVLGRACLESPDDPLPRLALADYLEEAGGGNGPAILRDDRGRWRYYQQGIEWVLEVEELRREDEYSSFPFVRAIESVHQHRGADGRFLTACYQCLRRGHVHEYSDWIGGHWYCANCARDFASVETVRRTIAAVSSAMVGYANGDAKVSARLGQLLVELCEREAELEEVPS